MAETIEMECWLCLDSVGDYAVGADAEGARTAYEENIQPLADTEGFRLFQVTVRATLPTVVELSGEVAADATEASLNVASPE